MLGKISNKSLQKSSYTGNITENKEVLQSETKSLHRDVLYWCMILIRRKKYVTLEEIDLLIICII